MVSLEEERLVQMVHDFIESESSTPPIFPASSNCLSINQARCFTLQEMLGRVTEAETRVLETLLKHMRNKNDAEKTTSLKMWLLKRLKMDGFNASICQTSWATSLGCPAGAYEYIDITFKVKKSSAKSSPCSAQLPNSPLEREGSMCPHGGRAHTCSPNGFLGVAKSLMTVTLVTAAEKMVSLKMAHVMAIAVCGHLQWLSPR
ncbi:uncharacterized protein [Populus alba]|uniref:uncharacterized protein n=1 Tax=Populus alba TaxID=43335 RepID=UPI001589323F|nr:uncharacterized protein LOC118032182 isoform X2 [Populus alba]XP_034905931.1 uncharacterized protein LOC118042392 [Populus alba]